MAEICVMMSCSLHLLQDSGMHVQKGGRELRPPTFAGHSGEISTFVSHLGEMYHSPTPYTSHRTPFGGLLKNLPPPHFQCAVHASVAIPFELIKLANLVMSFN